MGEYRLVGTRWVDVDIDDHRRYMQNASVFRKKTGAVRKACRDIEFGESGFFELLREELNMPTGSVCGCAECARTCGREGVW